MEIKTCGKCKESKEIDKFHIRNSKTGLRNSRCSACMKQYQAEHYQKTKVHHNKIAAPASRRWRDKKRQELKEVVNSIKSVACKDCNKTYPSYVMHFDHLDATTKKDNIATMIHGVKSLDSILQEIAKCEVVCANCHAERTYRRRQCETTEKWLAYPKSPTKRPLSKEHRIAISLAHKGRIVSDHTRKLISESKKGTVVSKETKIKLSRAAGGRPIIDSNGIRYETVNEAVRLLGLGKSTISDVLKGVRTQTSHGMKFYYIKEEE